MTSMGASDTQRIGPYELHDLIGRGGMAEVYRARRDGPGGFAKDLALKRIRKKYAKDERLVARFMDEARIAGALNHGNVVQVYDFGQVARDYFIAMELVEGMSLASLLELARVQSLELPFALIAFIGAEMCTGLAHAHGLTDPSGKVLDLVHRDVSPQNVMLAFTGDVKIADFGIAKAADSLAQTEAGLLVGKTSYMSPEQAGGKVLDGRSDLFSAGIVLWEALTLEPMLPRDDASKALEMLSRGAMPRPSSRRSDTPKELEGIVMQALAQAPEDRFATGDAMARALRSFHHRTAPGFGRQELAELLEWLGPDGSRRSTPGHLPESFAPRGAIEDAEPESRSTGGALILGLACLGSFLFGVAVAAVALFVVLGIGEDSADQSARGPSNSASQRLAEVDDGKDYGAIASSGGEGTFALRVIVEPEGAEVYVDGMLVGASPVVEPRETDEPVEVVLTAENRVPHIYSEARPSTFSLEHPVVRLPPAEADQGVIYVRSSVPGAFVSRNGELLGSLPRAVRVIWDMQGDRVFPEGLTVASPGRLPAPVDLTRATPWRLVHLIAEPGATAL